MNYEAEYHRILQAAAKQDAEIINLLGPVLGYPTGPSPDICSVCKGGPCQQQEWCSKQCLAFDCTAEDLAAEAARRLASI